MCTYYTILMGVTMATIIETIPWSSPALHSAYRFRFVSSSVSRAVSAKPNTEYLLLPPFLCSYQINPILLIRQLLQPMIVTETGCLVD